MQPAFLDRLAEAFREDQIIADAAGQRAYECDAYTVDKSPPQVVVLPESTAEVQRVVALCNEFNLPFTPRGAGTGLSGGAMAALGGVVISLKRLKRILEIDVPNRRMRAEAGVVNLDLTRAVAAYGLHFAPDPSSQSVSTLGGNIAENSGGPHTLKRGVTYQHVLGVTMVLADGSVVEIGGGAPNAPGLDALALIVGSEGLLGIVTEAWVKLIPTPPAVKTLLAAFPTLEHATQCVSGIIASGIIPAALEMMDANILVALRQAFGLTSPLGTAAMLLVECDGEAEAVAHEIAVVERQCAAQQALSVEIAQSEAERQRLWTARKKGIGAMGRLAPSIVTHDGVIPRSKLPEMLNYVYEVAAECGVGVANLFHAGDGNLHPCFYFDDRDPAQVQAVIAAGERIIERCIELGGSVSGEHGIGIEKIDLLTKMFSADELKVQGAIKTAFNPSSLLNPCKVLPDQRGCIEHVRRWRGVAT